MLLYFTAIIDWQTSGWGLGDNDWIMISTVNPRISARGAYSKFMRWGEGGRKEALILFFPNRGLTWSFFKNSHLGANNNISCLEGIENKRRLQTLSIDNAWSNKNFLYYFCCITIAFRMLQVIQKFFIWPCVVYSMDNVCNRRLFSVPSKVEMAEEQRYL